MGNTTFSYLLSFGKNIITITTVIIIIIIMDLALQHPLNVILIDEFYLLEYNAA
jgi:hypothetical protein